MDVSDSDVPAGRTALAAAVSEGLAAASGEPRMTCPHDDVLLLSHREPSDHLAQVYDPVACLVVQGAKETATTDRSYAVGEGQFLVVTHDLPVVSRITQASAERPYLAVILSLDHETLVDLHDHAAGLPVPPDDDPYALSVGNAGTELHRRIRPLPSIAGRARQRCGAPAARHPRDPLPPPLLTSRASAAPPQPRARARRNGVQSDRAHPPGSRRKDERRRDRRPRRSQPFSPPPPLQSGHRHDTSPVPEAAPTPRSPPTHPGRTRNRSPARPTASATRAQPSSAASTAVPSANHHRRTG